MTYLLGKLRSFSVEKGHLGEKQRQFHKYFSVFLLLFPKKGRLPLYQVAKSFRPAVASAYKLAQANMAYSRFSFFISPRYTVFL